MARKPSSDETFWDESSHFDEDQQDFSSKECPICMEPLDVTDLSFRPCKCGYQMCRFCWHHIKENMNGKCPACRQAYNPENYTFTPPDPEEIIRIQSERKQKERQKKQTETHQRRALSDIRVIQRNLVYVTNIAVDLAKEEILKRYEYFGQYGKVAKLVINKSHVYQGVSVSCYVTYARPEEAFRCIDAVDGAELNGRLLRCSFGTTKYCSHFLRGKTCINPDCMYLHELGDDKDSFTKEDMQSGKHLIRNQQSAAQLKALLASGQAPKPPRKAGVVPKLPQPREDWTVDLEELNTAATGASGMSWKTQSMGAPPAHDTAQAPWKTQSQSIPIRSGPRHASNQEPTRPVWTAQPAVLPQPSTSPSNNFSNSAGTKSVDEYAPDIVSKSPSKQAAWPTLGAAVDKPTHKALRNSSHLSVQSNQKEKVPQDDTIDDGLFSFNAHPVAPSQAHPRAVWKTKSQPASAPAPISTPKESAPTKAQKDEFPTIPMDKQSPPRDGKTVWKVVPTLAPVSIHAELQKSEDMKKQESAKVSQSSSKPSKASLAAGSALPATASWGAPPSRGGSKGDGLDAEDELFVEVRKKSKKKRSVDNHSAYVPHGITVQDTFELSQDDSSLLQSTSSAGSSAPSTPLVLPEQQLHPIDPLSLAGSVDPFVAARPDSLDDWLKFTSELLLREQSGTGPQPIPGAPGMFAPPMSQVPAASPGARGKGRSRFQFAQDSDDSSSNSSDQGGPAEDDTRQNALRSLLPGINVKFSMPMEPGTTNGQRNINTSAKGGAPAVANGPPGLFPMVAPSGQQPQQPGGTTWGMMPMGLPMNGNVYVNRVPGLSPSTWGPAPSAVPQQNRGNPSTWAAPVQGAASPAKNQPQDPSAWRASGDQPHPDQMLLSMISSLQQQQPQQQGFPRPNGQPQNRGPVGWPTASTNSAPGFRSAGAAPPGFRVQQD